MDDTTEQPYTEAVAGPSIASNPLNISQEDLIRIEVELPILRELISPLPPDDLYRPIYLFHLSVRLGGLFSKKPDMALIFEAIDAGREAIDSLPREHSAQAEFSTILEQHFPGHPAQDKWFTILEQTLGDRFSVTVAARLEDTTDQGHYLPDCGPGEIHLGGLPRPRRILGCGPLNLPYDDNGNLNFFDIISGTFSDGRWTYKPIGKGIFTDDRVEREDVGAYEYETGDVLYEENGRSYIASRFEKQLGQKGRFLGLDSWRYFADSLPARLMGQKNLVRLLPKQHEATASSLCSECTNIKLESTLSSLHKPNSNCDLCAILSKCPKEEHPELRLVDARAYLKICSIPGSETNTGLQDHSEAIDDKSAADLLPGLPTFFESGSKEHFLLINEWLRLCDEGNCGHPSGCAPGSLPDMKPARILHVPPDLPSPNIVHLLTTNGLDEMGAYIALSHCWGSQPAGIPSWCTTPANEKERRTQGIAVESLPANFQDAIRVTRALGKEYLWIDSLCILQGDQADWRAEGRKMAGVFRNAYCVIAASSAKSSTEGFLDRPASKSPVQYVTVPESSHGPVFITSAIDDFVGDVEQGQLNTRAWVLQEHVLARRTIHFTDRQTYWECGGGIRCETLTYMRNEGRPSLFSDPNFPASLMDRATIAKVTIFLSFFEKYSQLGITVNTDKPIAIDALARELAGGLDTNFSSGVFDNFLHRCILWHKLSQPLERILFEPEFNMPSWSWMAYSGPIKYADINLKLEWDDAVKLKGSDTLEARLVQLQLEEQNCQISLTNLGHHDIKYANQDGSVGQLWFDDLKWEASSQITAAIIGREQQPDELQVGCEQRYFILLIGRSETGESKRIGMGYVERRLLKFDDLNPLVCIT